MIFHFLSPPEVHRRGLVWRGAGLRGEMVVHFPARDGHAFHKRGQRLMFHVGGVSSLSALINVVWIHLGLSITMVVHVSEMSMRFTRQDKGSCFKWKAFFLRDHEKSPA